MPSGKTHLRIELTILPVVAVVYNSASGITAFDLALFSVAYVCSSLWLSPDLDLLRNSSRNRWGALSWIWEPYARIFKHRGMSHHPILGPFTRVLYLAGIIWIIVEMYRYLSFPMPDLLIIHASANTLLSVGLGIYMPNLIHVAIDYAATLWRRNRKNKNKKQNVQHVGQ